MRNLVSFELFLLQSREMSSLIHYSQELLLLDCTSLTIKCLVWISLGLFGVLSAPPPNINYSLLGKSCIPGTVLGTLCTLLLIPPINWELGVLG